MANHESVPLRVSLTVEVDGHALHFEQETRAWGTRCYGEDPAKLGVPKGGSLEDQICIAADTCFTDAVRRAEQLLGQMYPVALDDEH